MAATPENPPSWRNSRRPRDICTVHCAGKTCQAQWHPFTNEGEVNHKVQTGHAVGKFAKLLCHRILHNRHHQLPFVREVV